MEAQVLTFCLQRAVSFVDGSAPRTAAAIQQQSWLLLLTMLSCELTQTGATLPRKAIAEPAR
jgi:hypothetical protein